MAINITTEKYDPLKIELIKKNLETQTAQGAPLYFEIFVDNLKVVQRTNKVELFDSYEEFVDEDTKKIRIQIYSTHPTTPRNTKHIFLLKEDAAENKTLQGIDLDKKISEQVTRERERWDCEQVRRELEEKKEKLKEASEYIEKLQTAIEHYKTKKLHLGDINLGELTSVVVEGMIRRNPQMLAKIPGGESLAGIIEKDNQEREEAAQQKTTPEGEATFKKKEEQTAGLSDEEKRYLGVLREMEEKFDDEQVEKVVKIIQSLAADTTQIDPVVELLSIPKQTKNTEQPNEKV